MEPYLGSMSLHLWISPEDWKIQAICIVVTGLLIYTVSLAVYRRRFIPSHRFGHC